MGIVLPDSILGAPGLGYVREWLMRNTKIIASLDLHQDTFQPHNGTQTSVLVLQKKTGKQKDKEEKSREMEDYGIFMAVVDKIGHDRRGNPIFKRDEKGNELLEPDEAFKTWSIDYTATRTATFSETRRKKSLDDQTIYVPAIFSRWKNDEGIKW
jgi:type I restriction enzyme M protein